MPIMKILFTCSGIEARMKSSVALLKSVKVMMNVQNARKATMRVNSGHAAQYVIHGTIETIICLILFYY